MKNNTVKAILVRMDRIGDLVLTLPVDELLPSDKYDVLWLLPKGLGVIAKNAVPSRAFKEFGKDFSNFTKMLKLFKTNQPELIIIYHAPWWVSLAAYMASIPIRAGVISQWHSFLFLNRGLRQKRSEALKHEMHYNFDLTFYALKRDFKKIESYLKIKAPDSDVLTKLNLNNNEYIVVHPGMGGSALNWPIKNYEELIKTLSVQSQIVITGTKNDNHWLSPLKQSLSTNKNVVFVDDKLNLDELFNVLENASCVVAPSTGVAHLAASLETPIVGLYSPIIVEHPRRWGPRGPRVVTLVPDIGVKTMPPRQSNKSMQKTISDSDMASITIKDVLSSVNKLKRKTQ